MFTSRTCPPSAIPFYSKDDCTVALVCTCVHLLPPTPVLNRVKFFLKCSQDVRQKTPVFWDLSVQLLPIHTRNHLQHLFIFQIIIVMYKTTSLKQSFPQFLTDLGEYYTIFKISSVKSSLTNKIWGSGITLLQCLSPQAKDSTLQAIARAQITHESQVTQFAAIVIMAAEGRARMPVNTLASSRQLLYI